MSFFVPTESTKDLLSLSIEQGVGRIDLCLIIRVMGDDIGG